MAYQGRKVFVAGTVLTASDMNSTVDQTAMVFADAAARDTAIPSPTDGMLTYLEDVARLEIYNGTAFVQVNNAGVSDKADDYTVLTSDKNSLIRVTAATAKTITIGTATAFQVGDRIDILQDGEGVVTVDVTGDATLAGRGEVATAYTIGQQYDAVSVVCVAENSYRIIGNATAV
jgi:hypothetical protein